MIGEKRAMRKE